MTEIYLVRHGETAWNVREVFRGKADIDLNETGLKQAALLGAYLKEVGIDAVFSSPLQRAVKTAGAIAGHHGLKAGIIAGLSDIDYGEWQGLSLIAVKKRYPGLYADWTERPGTVRFPGGESLYDVRRRARAALAGILKENNEGRVVIVSHRVVNKVLICSFLGLGNSHFWNIRQDTCGLTIFSHQAGKFVLVRHNDTSFLESTGTGLADF